MKVIRMDLCFLVVDLLLLPSSLLATATPTTTTTTTTTTSASPSSTAYIPATAPLPTTAAASIPAATAAAEAPTYGTMPATAAPNDGSTTADDDDDDGTAVVVPWTTGVPTRLIRKVTLVEADPTVGRLPVHTLTFAIPDDPGRVMVGQAKSHREINIDLGDVVKMVIPNYKPKSYSVSALRLDDGEFDVTFKVYPNGRASGVLDRLHVGDTIHSFGRSANRTRNINNNGGTTTTTTYYVGIVVFGVGITEGLPVARAECEKLSREAAAAAAARRAATTTTAALPDADDGSSTIPKVKLLWASRTMEDTFWHDDIRSLERDYPNVFEVVYLLSRQEKEGCLYGHISPQLLGDVFQPPLREEAARFLSVGTKEAMRLTDAMFAEIGYPMPQHHLLPKGGDGIRKETPNTHRNHIINREEL